jgi:Ca2+/Na+ antiporter
MVSGLIWLAAPTVVHQLKSNKEQSIAALLLAVLWAVSLLFDSFLTWKNFNAFYILYACLAHQSFMPNYRADKTS